MPRTLYIHVGPAKTGTSAIQALFRDLDDPHLTYPRTAQWPDGSHNMLPAAMNGVTRWGNTTVLPLPDLIRGLGAELANAPQDALISSEGLANPASYTRLLDELGDAAAGFDSIVPILVLRHPIERAASGYNQRVKDPEHGERRLPDDFLRRRIPTYSLSPLLAPWQRTAPNLRLLNYHPAQQLAARFCDLIGRPDLLAERPPWKNRSLALPGLALVLLGNRHLPAADARRAFFTDVVRYVDGLELWRGASFPFSPGAVDRALTNVVLGDLQKVRGDTGFDLSDWSAPDVPELSAEDGARIRQAAHDHLPKGPALETDIDDVLAAFGAPGRLG